MESFYQIASPSGDFIKLATKVDANMLMWAEKSAEDLCVFV